MLSERRAGILCHVTSLPGKDRLGSFGEGAYKFIDFLSSSGFTVWQILPLGPVHSDNSPYQSLSAHAGNIELINLDWLREKNWISQDALDITCQKYSNYHQQCLQIAYKNFTSDKDQETEINFQKFIKKHEYWLTTFSLFIALREHFEYQPWTSWPKPYRDCEPTALEGFREKFQPSIQAIQFQQFVFFTQWEELKNYANKKGILILGDLPIFVSHDSADVWANRKYFTLDASGHPEFVAGVPPDYFSTTGQRWGNPHYEWLRLEEDGFNWWVDRIKTQYELYDAIRIDHFLGLVRHWVIPASDTTAMNGRWVLVPGKHLLQVLIQIYPNIQFIAEDLGTVTPEVLALRDEFSLPGMVVLQFAFDGSQDNPHLPKNHAKNSVAYTATHDNDTTLGWYESLNNETKNYIHECINFENEEMPWPMLRVTLESKANLAMFPMQDILCLGSEHRMNTPGTTENNWLWRFEWQQIDADLPTKLTQLLKTSNR